MNFCVWWRLGLRAPLVEQAVDCNHLNCYRNCDRWLKGAQITGDRAVRCCIAYEHFKRQVMELKPCVGREKDNASRLRGLHACRAAAISNRARWIRRNHRGGKRTRLGGSLLGHQPMLEIDWRHNEPCWGRTKSCHLPSRPRRSRRSNVRLLHRYDVGPLLHSCIARSYWVEKNRHLPANLENGLASCSLRVSISFQNTYERAEEILKVIPAWNGSYI